MKKRISGLLLTLSLAAGCLMMPENAVAAQYGNGEYNEIGEEAYEDTYEDTDEDDGQDEIYEGEIQEQELTVYYGEQGTLSSPASWTDHSGVNVPIASAMFTQKNAWDSILTLDEKGVYQVTGVGTTEAEGRFYDASGRLLLTRIYDISSQINMKGVTLDKTSVKGYVARGSYDTSSQFSFRLKSAGNPLPANANDYEVSCSASNSDMYVSAYMSDNRTVILDTYGTGKTTVTLVISGKTFKVRLYVAEVGINRNSLLLAVKQTGQLKVTGLKEKVKWSSSRPGVVKVSSDGTVRALKTGNAVIKARVGDITLGCAVSVVTPQHYQTIRQAVRIGANGTYSQPKRMQKGFYDCSSLTWMAYKRSGINFGDNYYAPVAADQAKWCMQRKKYIQGGLSASNIQNMKLNAGDLMFEEGNNNGRYRNIYHVEMIKGYTCYGFDANGQPLLGIAWANRPDDYYWPCGQLVCRP